MKLKPRSTFVVFSTYFLLKIQKYLFTSEKQQNTFLHSLINKLIHLSKDFEYVLTELVLLSKPVSTHKKRIVDIELHNTVCHKVMIYYLLSIKSFLHFSSILPTLIIHDDGSLTSQDFLLLKKHLPFAQILSYEESTTQIIKDLKKYPTFCRLRKTPKYPYTMIGLGDMPHFSKSKKVLYMDTDILFYKKPQQLLNWIDQKKEKEFIYMADFMNSYSVTQQEYKRLFKKDLFSKLNMGIIGFDRSSISFPDVELFLNNLVKVNAVNKILLDQTYWMHHAQFFYKKTTPLSDDYVLSFEPLITKKTVCVHYVTAIRHQIYEEGLKLIPTISEMW